MRYTLPVFAFALLAPLAASANPATDGLARISHQAFDEVYVREGWAPSGGASLSSVALNVGSELDRSLLGTRDLERLRQSFEQDLGNNLAGSDNVVVDVTLTDLTPNRVLSERSSRYRGTHESFGIGGAAMEAVFRDADTGEVLMVIVDERRGRPLTGNFHLQSRQIWGDASDILDDWAAELPQAL